LRRLPRREPDREEPARPLRLRRRALGLPPQAARRAGDRRARRSLRGLRAEPRSDRQSPARRAAREPGAARAGCAPRGARSALPPYVRMLLMGEEYGERSRFLYFVSHDDPEVVAAVREGGRREFADLAWSEEIPDPQSPEPFARSRLVRERARRRDRRPLHAL